MSRVVIARHGETLWHTENRYAGIADIPLSEVGVTQAKQLAKWASGAELASIWASPLTRAVQTAEPSCAVTGLGLKTDHRLIELDFGRGEGLTSVEMSEQFPAEYAAFLIDPEVNHLPGGEDPNAAAERGVQVLREIAISGSAEARHLVIAHNTLLRLIMCKLLNIPLRLYRRTFPSLTNGAVTEMLFSDGAVGLTSLNVPIAVK